jgi:hypothetical protein
LAISLASAGTFTALAEVARSWLARDRTRKLVLRFFKDGKLKEVELSGGGDDIAAVIERIRSHLES